jgi:hypothetical protein
LTACIAPKLAPNPHQATPMSLLLIKHRKLEACQSSPTYSFQLMQSRLLNNTFAKQ